MQFVVLLIAVALVVKFWWVIVAVCFVGWLIWSLMSGYRRARDELEWERQAEADRVDGLRRRADQQQAWRLTGDPRGVFGDESACCPRMIRP
jgi:type VI protein secretion system component VasK